jgi:hypothetical protein
VSLFVSMIMRTFSYSAISLSSSNVGSSASLRLLPTLPLFALLPTPSSSSSLLHISSHPLPPLSHRETLETALERGFVAIPMGVMVCVLSFLPTYPDRMNAASKYITCHDIIAQHITAHHSRNGSSCYPTHTDQQKLFLSYLEVTAHTSRPPSPSCSISIPQPLLTLSALSPASVCSTVSYLLLVGVCSRWRDASTDHSFRLRVFSVESGARDQVKSGTLVLDPHTYTCISDAMSSALPGDTISLCAGHHWESGLHPCRPVRLISGSSVAVRRMYAQCVCRRLAG